MYSKVIVVVCYLLNFLASRFIGKFGGIGVCENAVKEGVEGSERLSGSDKDVSNETFIGSFIKFGSLWVKACVIQNGRCSVVAGGLKGFSLICSDVGVENVGYEIYKKFETFGKYWKRFENIL